MPKVDRENKTAAPNTIRPALLVLHFNAIPVYISHARKTETLNSHGKPRLFYTVSPH